MIKMKTKTKWFVVALIAIIGLIIILRMVFSVTAMASTDMEPDIQGMGKPPTHAGDLVVFTRLFRFADLRPGQFVVMDLQTPNGAISTVRAIDKVMDNGRFMVSAKKDSGIDSRTVGAIESEAIKGKVVWIIRQNQ